MNSGAFKIVVIMTAFISFYGVFTLLYVNEISTNSKNPDVIGVNYTSPDSSGFFDMLVEIASFNVTEPEIAFLNSTIFFIFSVMVIFIFLVYLRGG